MTDPIYIVICGHNEPYVAERDLKDMSREATIRDLARGEWGSLYGERFQLSSIIEVGTDKDVTDEFIAAASMYEDSFVSRADRIANTQDHIRDLRKHEAV